MNKEKINNTMTKIAVIIQENYSQEDICNMVAWGLYRLKDIPDLTGILEVLVRDLIPTLSEDYGESETGLDAIKNFAIPRFLGFRPGFVKATIEELFEKTDEENGLSLAHFGNFLQLSDDIETVRLEILEGIKDGSLPKRQGEGFDYYESDLFKDQNALVLLPHGGIHSTLF